MHALIVLAHPESQSFNAQLASTAAAALRESGHSVEITDLYREGFDPLEAARHYPARADGDVFNVMREQRHASDNAALPADVEHAIAQLERADLLVLQFPLWWWSMPAILKGWFDRVFVWGRVYSSRKRYPDRGHFRGKKALVSVTAGAPEAAFGPDGRAGNIDLVLWQLHFSLAYVGFSVLPAFHAFGVADASDASNRELSLRLEEHRTRLFTHVHKLGDMEFLKFNRSDDWDELGRLRPSAPSYGPFIRHVSR
jgi:NAD(P)H dehydrogenase (quinone)